MLVISARTLFLCSTVDEQNGVYLFGIHSFGFVDRRRLKQILIAFDNLYSACLYIYLVLFCCFSVLLVLRLPRLGKRELILVLFVRLFGLCLFGFIGFLFLLVSGKGCSL